MKYNWIGACYQKEQVLLVEGGKVYAKKKNNLRMVKENVKEGGIYKVDLKNIG